MAAEENPILDAVTLKLKHAGYKLTPQREVTVATLIDSRSDFLTAEEIFVAVKQKNPSIGLATVYRTLDILDELDIVNKIPLRDGLSRYEFLLENENQASLYLLCEKCGKVEEIQERLLQDTLNQLAERFQFQIKTQKISLYGKCQSCQNLEDDQNESA